MWCVPVIVMSARVGARPVCHGQGAIAFLNHNHVEVYISDDGALLSLLAKIQGSISLKSANSRLNLPSIQAKVFYFNSTFTQTLTMHLFFQP